MYAALDVGNTLVKIGIFNADKLEEKYTFNSLDEVRPILSKKSIQKIIISSVKQAYEDIIEELQLQQNTLTLNFHTPLPFNNLYRSATLGIDRIALVAGAQNYFKEQACLVIDMGTCITYDLIDSQGNYKGGAISPGLDMRFKCLHNFTARLPLVGKSDDPVWLGDDTITSIQSGVIHGISGELNSFIAQYKKDHGDLKVILSGGNANYFESRIKASIFAIPELLLVGLNAILRHNASS